MIVTSGEARCRAIRRAAAVLLSIVLVCAGFASGQEPPRMQGFSVAREDTKVADALADFERYRDKKQWEIAFRTLAPLGEMPRNGMLAGKDGFYFSSRLRIWQSLASLPPDGKEAYRLFYDAQAKQLFEQINKPATDERAILHKVFDQYFATSYGDRAADRLGDLNFEAGDFLGAESAWAAIVENSPDSDLPKLRLQIKRCVALARAGRMQRFNELLASVSAEFAGQTVKIAGKDVVAADYLRSIGADAATTRPIETPTVSIRLPDHDAPAWQMRFLDEATLGAMRSALMNMGWSQFGNYFGVAAPASAVDERRVYLNYLGIYFALDLKTGKMLWRSGKFSDLTPKFQQLAQWMPDADKYSVVLSGDSVLVTALPLEALNQQAMYRLSCLSADTGQVKWNSNSPSLGTWMMAGPPIVVDNTIYIAASAATGTELHLLAIDAVGGKLQWSVSLGSSQGMINNFRGNSVVPAASVMHRAGTLYVLTNSGALVAVNTAGHNVEWAFTYDAPSSLLMQQQRGMFFSGDESMPVRVRTAGTMVAADSCLYVKECDGDRVYALDPSGPSLKWARPVSNSDNVALVTGNRFFTIGTDIGAIDLQGRALQWNRRLPASSGSIKAVQSGDSLYAFAARGIFEIDMASGDVRRIFRGHDTESLGGTLLPTPQRLVCVSNMAVTAYPVAPQRVGDASVPPR